MHPNLPSLGLRLQVVSLSQLLSSRREHTHGHLLGHRVADAVEAIAPRASPVYGRAALRTARLCRAAHFVERRHAVGSLCTFRCASTSGRTYYSPPLAFARRRRARSSLGVASPYVLTLHGRLRLLGAILRRPARWRAPTRSRFIPPRAAAGGSFASQLPGWALCPCQVLSGQLVAARAATAASRTACGLPAGHVLDSAARGARRSSRRPRLRDARLRAGSARGGAARGPRLRPRRSRRRAQAARRSCTRCRCPCLVRRRSLAAPSSSPRRSPAVALALLSTSLRSCAASLQLSLPPRTWPASSQPHRRSVGLARVQLSLPPRKWPALAAHRRSVLARLRPLPLREGLAVQSARLRLPLLQYKVIVTTRRARAARPCCCCSKARHLAALAVAALAAATRVARPLKAPRRLRSVWSLWCVTPLLCTCCTRARCACHGPRVRLPSPAPLDLSLWRVGHPFLSCAGSHTTQRSTRSL